MLLTYLIVSIVLGGVHFLSKNRSFTHALACGTVVLQWAVTVWATMNQGAVELRFFQFDGLAVLMMWALALIGTVALAHSLRYVESIGVIKSMETHINDSSNHSTAQYYGAMQFLFMALTMAYCSVHIATTWIFIEITTLSASGLIFYRRNPGSVEATWKYVFACSISLVFVYVGILLASIALGEHAEEGLSFDVLGRYAGAMDQFWFKMAFVFIMVGYSAKMSLVPMFTAGIDAKDKAPTPAAALLSSVLMNAGFVAFFRFYKVAMVSSSAKWASFVLAGIALVSLVVAAAYLVRVHNVKRLFAYSSVEHMAVAMLGIASGGIGIVWGTLHVVIHSLVKAGIFMHISHLYRVFGTKEFAGMGRYIRYTGAGTFILILCTLSITAMPPSGLFMTELMIFKSMIDAQWWWVLAVAMILLTVIVWGIARDMFGVLFIAPENPTISLEKKTSMPKLEMIGQLILLGVAIWLGFAAPAFVVNLIA